MTRSQSQTLVHLSRQHRRRLNRYHLQPRGLRQGARVIEDSRRGAVLDGPFTFARPIGNEMVQAETGHRNIGSRG
jgi:hypothetical protein